MHAVLYICSIIKQLSEQKLKMKTELLCLHNKNNFPVKMKLTFILKQAQEMLVNKGCN